MQSAIELYSCIVLSTLSDHPSRT